jgi:DNA-binding CsgD family transcriptional regulator
MQGCHLGARERSAVGRALAALGRVGPGSTAGDVLTALGEAVPFAAAQVETFCELQNWEPKYLPIGLPPGLPEFLMERRPFEPQDVMNVVTSARVGTLSVDCDVLPPELWERVEGYQAIRRAGFGSAAALKLIVRMGTRAREHTYIGLFREMGAPPLGRAERTMVTMLTPAIRSALERLAVPLLPGERLFAQMIEDQTMGMVVLRRRAPREANRVAFALAFEYAPALNAQAGPRHLLGDFVDALICRPVSQADGRRRVRHPSVDQRRYLEASVHDLDPGRYDLPEPLSIMLLREILASTERSPRLADALAHLTPRQRQVARLLITTGLTHEEIGLHLGIATRTVDTHVQTVFSVLGVHSRADLSNFLS